MSKTIRLAPNTTLEFTEPFDSSQVLTLQIGTARATIDQYDAEQLYYWLQRHSESFVSFYGKGWELAKTYWHEAGEPDGYLSRVELFNDHAQEIPVKPYRKTKIDGYSPTEKAVNGFFAYIAYERERNREEQGKPTEEEDATAL